MINKIIIHHTGGSYKACYVDKQCYHYIIQGDGTIVTGVYKPEDNINCKDGKYAQHTYLGNTGAIGVAVACNYKYSMFDKTSTPYPLNKKQYSSLINLIVELIRKYNIKLNDVTTHYMHDKQKNIKQGKSDITYLPWEPNISPNKVLARIREDISILL